MITCTWKCVFEQPKRGHIRRMIAGRKNSYRTLMHVVATKSEKEARQLIRNMYGKDIKFISVEQILVNKV